MKNFNEIYFVFCILYNVYRSLGIGIKKEEAKESGNGLDIFLYSCAAVVVAALHRRKTVKMV